MHSLLGESGIAGRLEWRGFAGNRGLLHSPGENGKNWLFLRYILHNFDRRVILFKRRLNTFYSMSMNAAATHYFLAQTVW